MAPSLRNPCQRKSVYSSLDETIQSLSKDFNKFKQLTESPDSGANLLPVKPSKNLSLLKTKKPTLTKTKHKTILPSDRDSIEKDSKLNITKLKDDTYLITIPNSPSNIEFQIETFKQPDINSKLELTLKKSLTNPEIFSLVSHYPVFDKDGKASARLITKRQYRKSTLTELKEPCLTSSLKITSKDQKLYDETFSKHITNIDEGLTIQPPDILRKIHNFTNIDKSTSLDPICSTQETFIEGNKPSSFNTSFKRPCIDKLLKPSPEKKSPNTKQILISSSFPETKPTYPLLQSLLLLQQLNARKYAHTESS